LLIPHILRKACWPTSNRHARLSAACLVEATNINDLKSESNTSGVIQKKNYVDMITGYSTNMLPGYSTDGLRKVCIV
jgi:hypothetical protein